MHSDELSMSPVLLWLICVRLVVSFTACPQRQLTSFACNALVLRL